MQPANGRKRKYCRRSCRQRAYEQRHLLKGINLSPNMIVLNTDEAAALMERAFVLRCAAEDLEIAVSEDASRPEIAELAALVVEAARQAERIR